MIERKDAIKGAVVIVNEVIVLINDKKYEEVTFPANTELTITKIATDKNNPLIRFSDGKTVYFTRFDDVHQSISLHTPANTANVEAHEAKLNQIEVLKKIKKIAVKDNLKEVLNMVDDEYFKTQKNVKTLMMYAIKSKKLAILKHGFENNWFKTIDFNDNVAIGEIVATPLYYAILQSTKEVQQYLIEQGASMSNKNQKDSSYTIEESLEYFNEESTKELINFEATFKEKNLLNSIMDKAQLNNNTKSKL